MYVVSDDWTKQIADKVNANEINVKEEGIKVALENNIIKRGRIKK